MNTESNLTEIASNQYMYKTEGVCAKRIAIWIEQQSNTITKVAFDGGCHGNGIAVSSLCKGRNVDEVIDILEGISCRSSKIGSSCGDQLSKALKLIKQRKENK